MVFLFYWPAYRRCLSFVASAGSFLLFPILLSYYFPRFMRARNGLGVILSLAMTAHTLYRVTHRPE